MLRLLVPVLAVASLAFASVVEGAVLAYDGFDVVNHYKANGGYANPLTGNSNALVWDADNDAGGSIGQAPVISGFGTTGWAAQTGVNISNNMYPKLENSQLVYQTGAGQKLNTTLGQVSIYRPNELTPVYKSFERDMTIPATFGTSPLYISGMFQFTQSVVTARVESAFTDGATPRTFGMRVDGVTGKLYSFGASAGEVEVATLTAGTTYFFVWELTNGTYPGTPIGNPSGDTLKFYLNPVNLASQSENVATSTLSSASANFFVHSNAAWSLDTLAFGATVNQGNAFILDELRFGTTWADVTPFTNVVPEPSRALLTAAALLGLTLRRKRQSC